MRFEESLMGHSIQMFARSSSSVKQEQAYLVPQLSLACICLTIKKETSPPDDILDCRIG